MKQSRIMFAVLLVTFFSSMVLETGYKWSHGNFPVSINIPLDDKNDGLVQRAFRAAMFLSMGAALMKGSYEFMKKEGISIDTLPDMAYFCLGGLLFTRGAALAKYIYENLGQKELL